MINRSVLSGLAAAGLLQPAYASDLTSRLDLEPLIVRHANANNVPAGLVHRIIIRESRYNARAVGRGGALGLMQIKHGTARALGYTGAPAGLLDAETNLTYGVRYLAGAYRVAGGDQNRAVGFYARGYYYDAKRRGLTATFVKGPEAPEPAVAVVDAAPQPVQTPSILSALFPPARPVQPMLEVAAPAVMDQSEDRVSARRNSRSAKRRTTAVATPPVNNAVSQAEAAVAVQTTAAIETELPAPPPRRPRPTQPKGPAAPQSFVQGASVEAAVTQARPSRPSGQEVEAHGPVKRSVRSAKQTAISGAGRSEQKASAQPGDPGTRP